jgi:hypothetical protein
MILVFGCGCLASIGAWRSLDEGDQQYIQQYCEQIYGSVYYEQESDRAKAIKECIDEQSQYYSQDEAPKQDFVWLMFIQVGHIHERW